MHQIKENILPFALLTRQSLEKRVSRSNAIGYNFSERAPFRETKDGKSNSLAYFSHGIQSISFGFRGKAMAGSPPGAFKANREKSILYNTIKNFIAPYAAKSYWEVLDREFSNVYRENSKKVHASYFISEPFTTATLNVNAQMACH